MSEETPAYGTASRSQRIDQAQALLKVQAATTRQQLENVLCGRDVGVGITADYLALECARLESAVQLLESLRR